MIRNKFIKKLLGFGLAVTMAITSFSIPGGPINPVDAEAEEQQRALSVNATFNSEVEKGQFLRFDIETDVGVGKAFFVVKKDDEPAITLGNSISENGKTIQDYAQIEADKNYLFTFDKYNSSTKVLQFSFNTGNMEIGTYRLYLALQENGHSEVFPNVATLDFVVTEAKEEPRKLAVKAISGTNLKLGENLTFEAETSVYGGKAFFTVKKKNDDIVTAGSAISANSETIQENAKVEIGKNYNFAFNRIQSSVVSAGALQFTFNTECLEAGEYKLYLALQETGHYGVFPNVATLDFDVTSVTEGGNSEQGGITTMPSIQTPEQKPGTTTDFKTEPDGSTVRIITTRNPDGSKKEDKTETKPDGQVITTVTITASDGSSTAISKTSKNNTAGNRAEVTTTTKTRTDGSVTAKEEKTVISDAGKNTSVTVIVKTDSTGISTAAADITITGNGKSNRTTISESVISQITEAAGTKDVTVTQKVTDKKGKQKYTVTAKADDLKAGNSLTVMKVDFRTGEKVLVDDKEYKVGKDGSISIAMEKPGTYVLLNRKDADKESRDILDSIKVKKSSRTVKAGRKTSISVKINNKENIKKITYTTSNKSVAKVNKNGTITAKRKGSVTVRAKVTLKNGKTKTVSMKVKVR